MKRTLRFLATALALTFVPATYALADGHAYIVAENNLTPQDEAQLRQVIARLNHALDAADYPMYGSFFADDGVFVSGFGNATGPDEVAGALQQVAPFITNKRHIAGNLVISGSGDEAVVTSYLIVFEREADLSYVGSAVNVDTFRKIDGVWKVMRHDSTLDPATARYIQGLMENL